MTLRLELACHQAASIKPDGSSASPWPREGTGRLFQWSYLPRSLREGSHMRPSAIDAIITA